MAVDVAQWKYSNIKCYTSAFSNILIDWCHYKKLKKSYACNRSNSFDYGMNTCVQSNFSPLIFNDPVPTV